MSKEAKQYLKQVKKHLCCPRSLSREFLRRLEDEILLFCEKENADVTKIHEHFGDPQTVAEDFFSALDVKTVSRYAYSKLKLSYWVLFTVSVIALSIVAISTAAHIDAHRAWNSTQVIETVTVHEGDTFPRWERTVYQGESIYWMYDPQDMQWRQIPKPADADDARPVPVNVHTMTEHGPVVWKYDDQKNEWYIYEEA